MKPAISMDRKSPLPLYRQVAEQIACAIRDGKLPPGERLPDERVLAGAIGATPATVRRAYGELVRLGLAEQASGRGTSVCDPALGAGEHRKERALSLIRTMIDGLLGLQFSFKEIGDFVHIMLMAREDRLRNFCIAVVDCNPEALCIYEKQLLYLAKAQVRKFLLDEVRRHADAESAFRRFDLILTTATHHEELGRLVPGMKDKILQAAVSPTQKTVAELASVSADAWVGILCQSVSFRDIIRRKLAALAVREEQVETAFCEPGLDLHSFLLGKTHLIVPPDFPLFRHGGYGSALVRFTEGGGRIIQFDYQIERGSLLLIEEAISNLLMTQEGSCTSPPLS